MRPADRAWCVLAASIVAYDVTAKNDELLSEAVDRYLQTHPWLTRGVVAVVALHLLNVLQPEYDPLHKLFLAARWTRKRFGVNLKEALTQRI